MIHSSHRAAHIIPHRHTGYRIFSAFLSRVRGASGLLVLLAILCASTSNSARAQSQPTASRAGDLQLGAGFVFARSGYNFTPLNLLGYAGYIDFANRPRWGGEFIFHQAKPSSDSTVYERTYEIGPRIMAHRGPFVPYAKVLYGRGVYNFHNSIANVAYNMVTAGCGIDFALRPTINIRADYEFQTWMSFPIADLHPSVFTLGVAYHFHQ